MKWDPLYETNDKPIDEDLLQYTLAKQALVLEGQTIIHCNYVASDKYVNGGWVNICKTTFFQSGYERHANHGRSGPKGYAVYGSGF